MAPWSFANLLFVTVAHNQTRRRETEFQHTGQLRSECARFPFRASVRSVIRAALVCGWDGESALRSARGVARHVCFLCVG